MNFEVYLMDYYKNSIFTAVPKLKILDKILPFLKANYLFVPKNNKNNSYQKD